MRLRALLPAVAAVAVLAGCGQTGGASSSSSKAPSFTGQQKAVADKVGDLESAGRQRKGSDICDKLLTAQLRDQIAVPGSDCATEMKKATEDADVFDLTVTAVQIQGSQATARVRTTENGKDHFRTLRLAKAGATWRISSFG